MIIYSERNSFSNFRGKLCQSIYEFSSFHVANCHRTSNQSSIYAGHWEIVGQIFWMIILTFLSVKFYFLKVNYWFLRSYVPINKIELNLFIFFITNFQRNFLSFNKSYKNAEINITDKPMTSIFHPQTLVRKW